ncbi:MAG: chemotaxis protein CheW [Burkholderiaceae bacterium]|nr:chemotaxis protein CheW [Burkholderiaceae bacterium]
MTLPTAPLSAFGSAAAGNAADRMAGSQLLRLAVGPRMYAVPIEQVREILKVSQLTVLPLMPAFVRGVMNLRGAVVPVIDLGARLGGPTTALARRTCVVIVEQRSGDGSAQTLGVLVDAVHEVVDTGEADLEPVPTLGTEVDTAFLAAMARLRGEIVPVLALDRVLDEEALAQAIATHAQPADGARLH